MNKPISVLTGATGHIGYALLLKLVNEGENVRILIRKDSKIFDGIECEKVYGDVTDPESLEKAFEGNGGNKEAAKIVGRMIAEKAVAKGIKKVVFDRGGYIYHGRVKELADGAREGGLEF